ncbi:MAG: beta-galactosidase [Candidatus Methylacidiphilales bacterium]|nr:beta-galactosidase [Candidatus Methylacidiphilales bacterium]
MKPTPRMPAAGFIMYGADYNPDQWLGQERVLSEDIELMKKAWVTSASIGIFSWTAMEPKPGVYTFDWLDAVMERFAKAGMKVFLATPSGSKPMWLSEKHIEIRRVGLDGRREPSGGRHNHCLTSPVYREAVYRINRTLALRYGKHPALALWHIGNELSGECHCDLCRSAFHAWLRQRYVSLDKLNSAWWTSFWNHTFTDWSQIPTYDRSIDGLALDWKRFVNDQHCSFLDNEMAPLREITPDIPCTTNFMGTHHATNYWQWSGKLDCISNDHYPLYDDREDGWKKCLNTDFVHSLMRGMAHGGPWILMECSPSSVNWGKVNKLKRPRVHLQEVLQAVANGADVIHYFQWRKGRGGSEKFHGAVVDHEGSSHSRVFKECTEVGKTLGRLNHLVGARPDRAPVALVYDWESRWALSASAGPKVETPGDLYTHTCEEHFRALRCAGIEVDVISVDGPFSDYSLVVTPALFLLRQETAQKLAAYVEEGGHWLATYLTGYVDGHNRCWGGGFPGPNLRELFGLWNEEVDYLYDDEQISVRGTTEGLGKAMRARDVIEHLHAEGAKVMATLASDFYAGAPIILGNQRKKGSTTYIGARLDEESLLAVYRLLGGRLELPRQPLPLGVVRKTRPGSEGPVEFLFNYSRHDVEINLGNETFLRLSDDRQITGRTTLRPNETLIGGFDLTGIKPKQRTAQPAPNL